MQLGVSAMPGSIRDMVEMAQAAEASGVTHFGVGDGPWIHQELYPSITAMLLGTSRIAIGPCTSNNVTRRWTVHASTARTLDELAPGRFFLGLATGDGSVRSTGDRPQSWSALAEEVALIRERTPGDLVIQGTASGLRGARSVGSWADVLVVGTGADAQAIRNLAAAAREGAAGRPMEVWAMVPVFVIEDESERAGARERVRSGAYSTAHFAFASTFEGKNVPLEHQQPIREGLATYDYRAHGLRMDDHPNAGLLADHPETGEYLVDRMFVVGTEDEVRTRLAALCADAELDGLWLPVRDVASVVRFASLRPGTGTTA